MNLQKSFDLWEASNASNAWKNVKQLPSDMIHSHA
jgi:plasmid maintenance system antidote protein VapI